MAAFRCRVAYPIGLYGFTEAAIAVGVAVPLIFLALLINATVLTADTRPARRNSNAFLERMLAADARMEFAAAMAAE